MTMTVNQETARARAARRTAGRKGGPAKASVRVGLMISTFDKQRLSRLLDVLDRDEEAREEVQDLEREIERGAVVRPEEMPADVVTMNSSVRVTDLENAESRVYTIVFPSEANYEQGKISILAPLGVALLGYRVGDTVEWNVPRGVRTLRIDEIVFQPERAGVWHL
jgi:regulator of nucleoside diphosphate kinase